MAHFIKSKATAIANLIAGRGLADRLRRGLTAVTSLNWTSSDRTPEIDRGGQMVADKKRLKRLVYAGSDPEPIDTFAFDMLRRAASITDGNAFFSTYDPKEAGKVNRRKSDDLSLQYDREAGHAAMALDGLNIVTDDLVLAAAMGKSFERLDPGEHAPSEPECAEALQRVVLRLVCDTGDEKVANIRLSAFINGLEQTRKSLFGDD